MRTSVLRLGVAVVSVLLVCACSRSPEPVARGVSVAAASSMKHAMQDLAAAFEAKHSGTRITVTYGSSGNFHAQLSNGAPFDVFFSADTDYPRKLAEAGLATEQHARIYARGQLVVFARAGVAVDIGAAGLEALRDPAIVHIAIANPRHAPYGRAAESAMKSLALSDAVAAKLVFGENVEQTAQFIQSGAAEVGFIPLSVAINPALKDAGRYWPVPAASYDPIDHACIILKTAKDPDSATAFRDFVTSAAGREILARHGFSSSEP